jgi:hypothetical protein
MPLDLSEDYLAVDLYEPITLVSVATAPGTHSEERSVSRAFRRGLTTKEMQASSGAYVRMDTAFDVPMKLTQGYNWKPGDTLTDGEENSFVIYTATKDPTTAFWSLVVYDPKIAYDLRHEIDVYEKQFNKDASSAPISDAETLLYSDVSCRVQWQVERGSTFSDRSGESKEATIYSSQRLYLNHNCVINWTDPDTSINYIFDVKEWKTADRLDELMAIRVEARP